MTEVERIAQDSTMALWQSYCDQKETIAEQAAEIERLNAKLESYESAFLQVRVAMGLGLHSHDNLVDVAKEHSAAIANANRFMQEFGAERDKALAEVETAHRAMAVYDDAMDRLRAEVERLKQEQAEPEFIKHEVDNATDWSEWVCPDPNKYLIKCCDCGLVHEAQYRVVKYNNEDFTVVDDVDTQAQFRMRRSEDWTCDDMAHRAGGLSMEQAEPVSQFRKVGCADWYDGLPDHSDGGGPYESRTLYTAPQGQTALLRQALEALELADDYDTDGAKRRMAAITAIKNHLGEA